MGICCDWEFMRLGGDLGSIKEPSIVELTAEFG